MGGHVKDARGDDFEVGILFAGKAGHAERIRAHIHDLEIVRGEVVLQFA